MRYARDNVFVMSFEIYADCPQVYRANVIIMFSRLYNIYSFSIYKFI